MSRNRCARCFVRSRLGGAFWTSVWQGFLDRTTTRDNGGVGGGSSSRTTVTTATTNTYFYNRATTEVTARTNTNLKVNRTTETHYSHFHIDAETNSI